MSTTHTRPPEGEDAAPVGAAALTAALLDAEDDQASTPTEAVVDDAELIGVGGDGMSLRQVLRAGGPTTAVVLFGLNFVDEFDRLVVTILGPEIQDAFGLSDAALAGIANVGAVAVLCGAVPLGLLADRRSRRLLIGATTLVWAVAAAAGGLARSAWQLAATRVFNGLGKGNEPVHNSLLADAYPIEGRGRVFAFRELANPAANAIGPLVVGGLAVAIGGAAGWRWTLALLSVPALVLAVAALTLPEPDRGRYERQAAGLDDATPADTGRIDFGAGLQRLKAIRTFAALLTAIAALGLGAAGAPTIVNLILQDTFGLDSLARGTVASITSVGGVVGLAIGGPYGDRLFQRDPSALLRLIGGAMAVFGILYPLGLFMPRVWMLVVLHTVAMAALNLPGAAIKSLISVVVPARMRGLAFGVLGIYFVLVGGLIGGIVTGLLSDAVGQRTSLAIIMPLGFVAAGIALIGGARNARHDIAMVRAEMLEEQAEARRVAEGRGHDDILQVRGVDFSYGPVQVLFDVDVSVRRGEVLALLGTNGAGKSTLLRVISGLGVPSRGVVRLDGENLTLADAGHRVRQGIVQVPGGKAIFPTLTVEENLLAGAWSFVWDTALVEARAEEVLTLFPRLRERLTQPAGTMSGGEAQMLAIAKALMLQPRVLLIDELSLGLAPVVVQDLLATVERLKAEGITMVIVEQSVNVALSVADRAVFMEKGQVRFEGPAAELLERDDLVRAVFLGGEGG